MELDISSLDTFLSWAKHQLMDSSKLKKELEVLKSEYIFIRNISLVSLFSFSISVIFPLFSILLIKRFCDPLLQVYV